MNGKLLLGRAWIALGVALALGAAACVSGDANKAGGPAPKVVVLTLADGEQDVSNAQPFADAVRELSKGALQIEIKSPWRPRESQYETALIKDVEAGKAQMGITASRAFDTVGIDSLQALQAPFLIESVALERKVLDSELSGKMLEGLKPSGLVGLGILPGPLRRPLGFAKPLLSASDYQGARIGIRASEVIEQTLQALGATPVVLARDPSISGLDGVAAHLAAIDAAFAEHGAVITGNVVLDPRPNVIFMSQKAFDSLSATQQSVLVRAAAQARTNGGVYQADGTTTRDLCKRGLKIVAASDGDLAGLRAAVQPVYDKLESNTTTRGFIEEITSMHRELGDSPDAVTCSSSQSNSRITTTATALDGKWEVAYTRSELLGAGALPDEICCGNWGRFALTLDRGHWLNPRDPPTLGWPASGTYVVNGDQITFYRTDHAYPGSDTEIWGPYTWSVYRDTLTFEKSASFDLGPTGLTVKPWHKIGG